MPANEQEAPDEVIRSGFLEDGRFFSLELRQHGLAAWDVRMVLVPGERKLTVRTGTGKQELRRWARRLEDDELTMLARGYGAEN